MAKSEEILSQIPEDRHEIYQHYLEQEEKEVHRLLEATTTSNVDKVVSVFIPAIKKLARDSFIDKLVGVQPIDDRIAVVEFMDYVYNTQDTGANKDGNGGTISQGDSAIDNVTTEYGRDPGEAQTVTKGFDFILREKEVKARSKKFLGKWSFEVEDRMKKRKMSADKEITKAMSSKTVEEINYELLYDLYTTSGSSAQTWVAPLPTDAPAVKDRKEQELYYSVVEVASQIYDNTRRYPTFLVANPRIGAYLKRGGGSFTPYVTGGDSKKPLHIGQPTKVQRMYVAGNLNDEFDLYIIPNLSVNKILIGYKGASEVEAGAFYLPYIPYVMTESFFNKEYSTLLINAVLVIEKGNAGYV